MEKTVIHIPNFRVGQYFIRYQLLFKNFTNLQQILDIKKIFALAKNPKISKLNFNKDESSQNVQLIRRLKFFQLFTSLTMLEWNYTYLR